MGVHDLTQPCPRKSHFYEPADALDLVQRAGRREIDVQAVSGALRRWVTG